MIKRELALAKATVKASRKPARRFKEFLWTTLDSWSHERRVIAKAEWTQGEANPRFVITSLGREEADARRLYQKVYCARGDMENRIKGMCFLRLRSPLRPAPHRAQAHAVRQSQRREHPPQIAEDRRSGAALGPPHHARHGLILPQSARMQNRHTRLAAARPDEPTTHSPHNAMQHRQSDTAAAARPQFSPKRLSANRAHARPSSRHDDRRSPITL
jgi:hypothetical protein